MGLIIGGASARDLILDSQSVSLYVGGNPPTKVWPTGETRETVQITLGPGSEAYNQFRAALADRGLDPATVTVLPFEIELVGSGSVQFMFWGCSALTSVPDLDTSSVTGMNHMFNGCSSLTAVPDLDTAQVINASSMFQGCSLLTDGNVRLIGRHPSVYTSNMIAGSGLTREPFYDTNGNPI